MTNTNYEKFNKLNVDFFEREKISLQDPLGLNIARDVSWIKLNEDWNSAQFPVVIGGKGSPIILLHGFDSSLLEFRRIYPSLKENFQVIVPDLLGFGFTPRYAVNQYTPSKIISHLVDIIKALKINKKIKIVGASMGGSAAIQLANQIPDCIDKIILLSPYGLF